MDSTVIAQHADTFGTALTIITSAAVGTLVSSIAVLIGQGLERRSRRKELILSKALELAFRRTDVVKEIALKAGQPAEFRDDASLAGDYYRVVEHLFNTGTLPDWFVKREAASRENHAKPKAKS